MGGMGGAVAAFMVRMDGQEQTHILSKAFVFEAQHVGEITAPVQRNIG